MINHAVLSQRYKVVVVVLAYGAAWWVVVPLVMYSGRLSGRSYVQVIEEALSLFVENTFDSSNNDWVFNDNAPPHRYDYAVKWFESKGIKDEVAISIARSSHRKSMGFY